MCASKRFAAEAILTPIREYTMVNERNFRTISHGEQTIE